MDIATVVGIIAGFGLILISIILGGSLDTFINVPAVVIVIGGTISATLINYPLTDVIGLMGPVRNAFFTQDVDPRSLISKLTEFATPPGAGRADPGGTSRPRWNPRAHRGCGTWLHQLLPDP